ncbi:MAG: PTS glucose transporter subunit IIA [Clostridiales bacterium]|nr:PTS glucose transporter subunit IIA [Clostridiales bacterium]
MGIFDLFKKQDDKPTVQSCVLAADAKGVAMAMDAVPDPAFSGGAMGQCCGIDPTEGKVYAPADGSVTQLHSSFHALSMTTTAGVNLLIHIGVDTYDMNGDGFSAKVREGDKVKKGQLLLTMDLDKIKAAGHSAVVITAVTNSGEVSSVELVASGSVEPGQDLLKVTA